MNVDVKVSMWADDDSERAEIRIRSFGCVSELRFSDRKLTAVAKFASSDMRRLLSAIKEAESKRVDPNPKTMSSLDYIMDRIHYLDEDKTRLYLDVEAEIPISSSGSVKLEPNLEGEEIT